MICLDRGITAYTDRYLLGRSVSSDYALTLRARIEAFCRWCGADVPVYSLSCELANEWLADLEAAGASAWSLAGYRGALLAVWNYAYQNGDVDEPPLRVRKVRRPRLVVEAYSHGEIRALLTVAAKLLEVHRDGNRARDFWQAAIHVAYCCGPRRGDLLAVEWRHVSPDGVLRFVQHKTGYPLTVQLSPEALELCRRLKGDKLLPWPYNLDWFSRRFKRLRKAAGVERGTFRWIRRSAGSYAERDCPGAGARLLGHRDPSVFRRFYADEGIIGGRVVVPPRL